MFVATFANGKFAGVTTADIDNSSKSGNVAIHYEDTKPDEVKVLLWEDFWSLRPFAEKQKVKVN